MKTKLKEILCCILAAAICIGTVGCGNGAEKKTGKEAPTLTWYIPGDKQTDIQTVTDALNKKIEPQIGAKLDLQIIDTGSFQDKMTMMMGAGKEFDLCFTSNWTNRFLPNVSKGAYEPLDELLEKDAKKLKSALPDYVWNASKIGGKIYAVPNLQVLFYQTALGVFKKYADKYNFDLSKVKTTKDIEPFLEIIKQKEPDLYPYNLGYSFAMFTNPVYEQIGGTTAVIRKDSTDKKVMSLYRTPEFKDGVETLRSWYQKGYIRSDIASVISDSQELLGGKYAVFNTTYKPGCEAELKQRYKQDIAVIPIEEPYLRSDAGVAAMTAISRTSKYKSEAIKLLEIVNTDKDVYNLLSYGVENKHYKKVNDNQIKPAEQSGYVSGGGWKFGNQFNAYYLETQDTDTWEKTNEINNSAVRSPISGFVLNTEPIKSEISKCESVISEFKAIENGSQDTESLYENFIKKLDIAGEDKIIKEVQKQINEMN